MGRVGLAAGPLETRRDPDRRLGGYLCEVAVGVDDLDGPGGRRLAARGRCGAPLGSGVSRCKQRAAKADVELKTGISPAEEAVIRRWLVSLAKRTD